VIARIKWYGGDHSHVDVDGVVSPAYTAGTYTHEQVVTGAEKKTLRAVVHSATESKLAETSSDINCAFNPPAQHPPSGEPRDNILPIAGATASSNSDKANRAIDDDLGTEWLSTEGMPQWFRVDLGGIKDVAGVGIYSLFAQPKDFEIKLSNDSITWVLAQSVKDAKYTNNWAIIKFRSRPARYVQIEISRATANLTAIHGIEVYTAPIAVPKPIPTPTPGLDPLLLGAIGAVVAVAGIVIFKYRHLIRAYLHYVFAPSTRG
jgi:hypothetical protein